MTNLSDADLADAKLVKANLAAADLGGAIKDIARGQVKQAANQIIELGKDLGPIIARTAAYVFFKAVGV